MDGPPEVLEGGRPFLAPTSAAHDAETVKVNE